jgi:hypothetical protein
VDQDSQHLRLLSIFQYIVAALLGIFSSFFLLYVGIGIVVVTGAFPPDEAERVAHPPMDPVFGWIFIVVGAFAILTGWTLAIAIAVAGRKLAVRRGYTYCLVVAAVECLFIPFGTVLGVFTIVVLTRPSVKALFEPSFGAPAG